MYSIKEKNVLKSIQSELQEINNSNNRIDRISNILEKINNYNFQETSWKDFELLFIQSHENFINKLKKSSKKLTSKQIRFCMFIKMGMDNYDISNLLNVGTRAIEQQRYRIKKELKISKSLDDYILEL